MQLANTKNYISLCKWKKSTANTQDNCMYKKVYPTWDWPTAKHASRRRRAENVISIPPCFKHDRFSGEIASGTYMLATVFSSLIHCSCLLLLVHLCRTSFRSSFSELCVCHRNRLIRSITGKICCLLGILTIRWSSLRSRDIFRRCSRQLCRS